MYLGKPAEQLSGVLLGIPSGADGVRATLMLMRELARRYRTDVKVIERAASLVQHLPQKSWTAEVKALHAYVRDGIRYLRDPTSAEKVQTPIVTMAIEHGDCDDKATLLASLLESIGHPARFVAVGFEPGRFSHVYTETKIGPRWVPLETTADGYEPGMQPLRVVNRMIVKV